MIFLLNETQGFYIDNIILPEQTDLKHEFLNNSTNCLDFLPINQDFNLLE